jgi:hypothetical protein
MTERRTRRTKEDLRALLLEAARTILLEEGLGVGADGVTFKRVFDRVEEDTGVRLTNASVIGRVWENQADYQTDVIVDMVVGDDNTDEFKETFGPVVDLLGEADLSTPERRWEAVREVCRVAGAANAEALRSSRPWALWIGVWALATSGDMDDRKRRIQAALLDGYESINSLYLDAYASLSRHLGFRLQDGLTMRHLTVAIGSLAEGCSLRNRVDQDMEGVKLPTGPDGELQVWTILGLGLDALTRRFLELDPEWEPPER